jgi:glycosyltransferase involved in cell wall biosynthesis
MTQPFVAIWMLSYNHEKYIAQAIEGVLMQQTSFSYKIYLGEDCSKDNTRNICIEYANKYPDKISLYLNEKNDIKKNSRTIYSACFTSGAKYIAMIEGDDYWTDPLKLQKQIDALEANPNCSICFHAVNVVYSDGSQPPVVSGEKQKQITTFEDLTFCNYINTVSSVYRNNLIKSIPAWFDEHPAGDWSLFLTMAQFGDVYYIDEPMAVYRINSSSSWANQQVIARLQKMILMLDIFEKNFDSKYIPYFRKSKSYYSMEISSIYHAESKKMKEFIYFYKACKSPNMFNLNFKDVLHKFKELLLN